MMVSVDVDVDFCAVIGHSEAFEAAVRDIIPKVHSEEVNSASFCSI